MKFLVAVLLISALAAIASAQTPVTSCLYLTCVAPGATCLGNTTQADTYLCQPGYYCNGEYDNTLDFPTCVKYVDIGGLCDTKTYRCREDLTCYTPAGGVPTCQKLAYAALGEECESTLQCASNSMECSLEGKCVLKTQNNAQVACNSPGDCAYGTWCNTTMGNGQKNLCQVWKANGVECTDNYECDYASLCAPEVGSTPTKYVCQPQLSKTEGQVCGENPSTLDFGLTSGIPAFDCDISANLQCRAGVCTAIPAQASCNATNTCTDPNSQCFCGSVNNDAAAKCVSRYNMNAACKSNIQNYLTCLKTNACGVVDGSVTKSSCAVEKCSKYICENPCPATFGLTCGDNQYNALCIATNGASLFAPSMAIVLIFAIVAMLF